MCTISDRADVHERTGHARERVHPQLPSSRPFIRTRAPVLAERLALLPSIENHAQSDQRTLADFYGLI